MTGETPWRVMWTSIEAAKIRLWEAQAAAYNEFLKALRMALEEYGQEMDPDSFDEYGQPIEPEDD